MNKATLTLLLSITLSSPLHAESSPISLAIPSHILPVGNHNGLSPTADYPEYGTDGSPLRHPIPFAESQCSHGGCHYPTNRWFTDLMFYAKANNPDKIADNYVAAQSPYYLKVYDSEHHAGEFIDLIPGLYTHFNLPYLSVNAKIKPTVNQINHDTYVSTLTVDPTYHFGLTVPIVDAKNTERKIIDYGPLHFTTQWTLKNKPDSSMTAYLVRGAPYLTMEYDNLPFTLTSFQGSGIHAIASDNQAPIIPAVGQEIKGQVFRFIYLVIDRTAGNKQKNDTFPLRYYEYMVFADQPITLIFTPNIPGRIYYTLASKEPLQHGMVRVAYVNAHTENSRNINPAFALSILKDGRNAAIETLLSEHANMVPVSAKIKLSSTPNQGKVHYHFQTKAINQPNNSNQDLLMMAFEKTQLPNLPALKKGHQDYRLSTLRGPMVPVIGNTWTLHVPYSEALYKENMWFGSKHIHSKYKPELQAALDSDFALIDTVLAPKSLNDSYAFGKEIARLARLALIADELGDASKRNAILTTMKKFINPWFTQLISLRDPNGITQGYFKYDDKFGGIITARAAADPSRCPKDQCGYHLDFYNGQYTDHHFHYGYFLYAAAVIAKYDADWLKSYKEGVNLLARDLANPSSDDPYFTPHRYFDWFEGHAFANGLVPGGDGRNQESTSESVNAWYGLALWGDITQNQALADMARTLTSLEIKAAQDWTQITPGKSVYDDFIAEANSFDNVHDEAIPMKKMLVTGINWSLKIDHTTFFGVKQAYITGIQMMPYTPISDALFSKDWLMTNLADLKTSVNQLEKIISYYQNASNDGNSIFDKYNAEFSQIKSEEDPNHPTTSDLYWARLQSFAEDARQWGLITAMALAPVDPDWVYERIVQNSNGRFYHAFEKINEAFAKSPRVFLGEDCTGKPDANVFCYLDGEKQKRQVGSTQMVRLNYESINPGQSITNNLWWVLIHKKRGD